VADLHEFAETETEIVTHILRHYEDAALSFRLFDQFRGCVDHSWERDLKAVLAKKSISNDEYK
jgi:hypothetical protein